MRTRKSSGNVTVSTAGTANTVAKFTTANNIGNSSITDNGTTVATTEALNLGAAAAFVVSASGLPTKSNALSLVGQGFPLCVAAPATTTGLTAANTNFINFTPPATTGDYMLIVEVDITTATNHSFSCNAVFTDPGGTSRTVVMSGFSPIGTSLTAGLMTNVTGAGVYTLAALMLSTDNSATAITLSTVGTFTTVTYTLGARLYRL